MTDARPALSGSFISGVIFNDAQPSTTVTASPFKHDRNLPAQVFVQFFFADAYGNIAKNKLNFTALHA